jgi:hypothetical protein
MLVFTRKRRIKFVVFILGCVLKFRILLTIRNTILLIVCSSLLCWRVILGMWVESSAFPQAGAGVTYTLRAWGAAASTGPMCGSCCLTSAWKPWLRGSRDRMSGCTQYQGLWCHLQYKRRKQERYS